MQSNLPDGARLLAVSDDGRAYVLDGALVLDMPGLAQARLVVVSLDLLAAFDALLEATGDALAAEQVRAERAAALRQPVLPAGAKCARCGDALTETKGADRRRGKWYCLRCLLSK